jgi:death-on-curing protein
MTLNYLCTRDVEEIYNILVEDFARADDPISPAGLRDRALLDSAVGRQHTGFGSTLKYPHPLSNAASLAYGLCCDHPFYNGNKRAALVAMLVHLDRNDYSLRGLPYDDLYRFITDVADHRFVVGRSNGQIRPDCDVEVDAMQKFLRKRAERVQRGERVITFRQLRSILLRFDIHMENSAPNQVELVRYTEKTSFFGKQKRLRTVVTKTGYRDDGTDIPKKDVKKIREQCHLTEQDGVDTAAFYTDRDVVDGIINRYQGILRRLART